MSTSQHDCIDIIITDKIIHIVLDRQIHDIVFNDPFFYQWDECRTRCFKNLQLRVACLDRFFICTAAYSHFRTDDPYPASCSAAACHRFGCRLDDPQDGDLGKSFAKILHTRRTDCIAGDNDHLHIALHQKICDFHGKAADRVSRLRSIRRPCSIAKIYDLFLGQITHHMRDACQSAQSGIKKTNRSVIHSCRNPPKMWYTNCYMIENIIQ